MKDSMRVGILAMTTIALSAPLAYADPHCTPTARVVASNYPGASVIPPSNNLLLPNGKAVAVEGQRLIITGHLVDSRCIPIPEAEVELWQTDPYGHWFLAEQDDLVNPNPTFAGAGRTTTDINGQFTFITAFPGVPTSRHPDPKNPTAPHVNLKIKAADFTPVTTMLYFGDDRRNAVDPTYKKLTTLQRQGVTLNIKPGENNDLNAAIEIVLPGDAPYRTY